MKEILEKIAGSLGYVFHYARRDFQNLEEAVPGAVHLFLDPVETFITIEQSLCQYSGSFLLVVRADLDKKYKADYDEDIYPLKQKLYGEFMTAIGCEDIDLQTLRIVEVVNLLDENYNGLIVEFKAAGHGWR